MGVTGVYFAYSKDTYDVPQKFLVSVVSDTDKYQYDLTLPGDRAYVNATDPIDEAVVEEIAEHEIKLVDYIRIVKSCEYDFSGVCVKIRKGPGTSYPYRGVLRNGQVLRAGRTIEAEGRLWQEIIFEEWLRYPNRARDEWWVAMEFTEKFQSTGWQALEVGEEIENNKKIVVNKTTQSLKAYEGDEIIFDETVSTGIIGSETPVGEYEVYLKTPSRYMQGPIHVPDYVDVTDPLFDWESLEDYYDLPGVPWNLYFSKDGLVIHGAYWHNSFGEPWSHGCVNVPSNRMQEIYEWADLGTLVEITE